MRALHQAQTNHMQVIWLATLLEGCLLYLILTAGQRARQQAS